MDKAQIRIKLFHDNKSLLVKTKRVHQMIFVNIRDARTQRAVVRAKYDKNENAEKAYSRLSEVLFKIVSTGCMTYGELVNNQTALYISEAIASAIESFGFGLDDLTVNGDGVQDVGN